MYTACHVTYGSRAASSSILWHKPGGEKGCQLSLNCLKLRSVYVYVYVYVNVYVYVYVNVYVYVHVCVNVYVYVYVNVYVYVYVNAYVEASVYVYVYVYVYVNVYVYIFVYVYDLFILGFPKKRSLDPFLVEPKLLSWEILGTLSPRDYLRPGFPPSWEPSGSYSWSCGFCLHQRLRAMATDLELDQLFILGPFIGGM